MNKEQIQAEIEQLKKDEMSLRGVISNLDRQFNFICNSLKVARMDLEETEARRLELEKQLKVVRRYPGRKRKEAKPQDVMAQVASMSDAEKAALLELLKNQ